MKRSVAFIVAMCLLLTAVVGGTLAVIIAKTDDIMNIFRPAAPTGDILLTKIVEHPLGSTYQIPDHIQFTYRVELGADMAGATVAGQTVAADGTIVVTVKPGASVELKDIPSGKQVKITEINIPAGFAPQDGAQRTVTVPMRDVAAVTFKNIYTPANAPVNVTVDGTKELEGRQWMEGDSFTFELSHKSGGVWTPCGQQKTVTYDAQNPDFNKFSFTDALSAFPFDHVGTYSFMISEVKGTIGGIDYTDQARTVSYLDITVTDTDMNGTLEISKVVAGQNATVTQTGSGFAVAILIRNSYAPDGSAQVTIKLDKTLEDKSGAGLLPEGFTFQLTDASGAVVATSAPTGAAGETSITLTYQAIDAGKQFLYTLSEVAGGRNGMTYDTAPRSITVDVIDKLDGTIRAQVYVTGTQAPYSDSCTVAFTNTYDPADTSEQVTGKKVLNGRLQGAGEFAFLLYASQDGVTIPEGTVPMKTSNQGNGDFAFESILYDKVGTYYYILKEDTSSKLGGVTYDETAYVVTVTVTDEDGQLKAVKKVTDIYGNPTEAVIRNTYAAKPTSVELVARKTLVGAELKPEQFNFLLYSADENFAYNAQQPLQSKHNRSDGSIVFDSISYDKISTHYYVLLESPAGMIPGMTPDATVYGITVTVNDNWFGKMVATTTFAKRVEKTDEQGVVTVVWEPVEALSFVNMYEAPPTTEPPTTQTQPEASSKPSGSPGTGDTTDPTPILLTMIISLTALAVLVGVYIWKQKKGKKE